MDTNTASTGSPYRKTRRGTVGGRNRRRSNESFTILDNETAKLEFPEVWPDVEERLLGHLRSFTHGSTRTPDTAASLMQKAMAFLKQHEEHLGPYQHPRAMASIAGHCVNRAMMVGAVEQELVHLYGDRGEMKRIRDYNEAVTSMCAPREGVGWAWWATAGLAMGVGALAMLGDRRVAGLTLLTASAAATSWLTWRQHKPTIASNWQKAWRLP